MVVDRHIGAEIAHAFQFLIARRNDRDMRAMELGEGEGEQRDPASALDQDMIARSRGSVDGNGAPCCQGSTGQRGRFFVRQLVGNADDPVLGEAHELCHDAIERSPQRCGKALRRRIAPHPALKVSGHTRSPTFTRVTPSPIETNCSDAVGYRYQRQFTGAASVTAQRHDQVAGVERSRMHADQHLTGLRFRAGTLRHPQVIENSIRLRSEIRA